MSDEIVSGLSESQAPAATTTRSAEPKAIRHSDDGTDRSISSREAIRNQLQAEVEQFLKNGGAVQKIDPHVTADPPTKPISNYGGRPI